MWQAGVDTGVKLTSTSVLITRANLVVAVSTPQGRIGVSVCQAGLDPYVKRTSTSVLKARAYLLVPVSTP